ncbi:hypothetical protein V12B01_12805 [Vibrio splendidus 12B01]|nr:hypothetical protein V12B01_12805 [Vibrio splendidus 12B01]
MTSSRHHSPNLNIQTSSPLGDLLEYHYSLIRMPEPSPLLRY